jgi:diguanylate cyclase (GGDEF)-like protein
MEERELMGPVSGLLWLGGAGVAIAGHALPGAPPTHPVLFWGLVALTIAYAAACVSRAIPWYRASLGAHAVAVALLQPLVGAALWLTGGAGSYMAPVLVLPMLYVAYFFPPRLAWPLAGLEIATYASPLVTSPAPHHLLLQRTLGYGVAYVAVVVTIQFLKRRLVAAERHQHAIARQDPLTGLANRRGFEEALTGALAAAERTGGRRAGDGAGFALLLADVDAFKQINDRFGHTTGDRVLRELAARAAAEARGGDCVARIGGDEFALVAPGAGRAAAGRLAEALRAAAAEIVPGEGADPVSITVSYAVHPDDGEDRAALMRAVDRDLHAGKDARKDELSRGPARPAENGWSVRRSGTPSAGRS